jgi:murein DD-endopeptidase MepM/ murein hydrolase activator NlpD
MNSLLDNQKIRKRKFSKAYMGNSRQSKPLRENLRRDAKRSSKAAFRPAGISSLFERNSRFIEKVVQHPAQLPARQFAKFNIQNSKGMKKPKAYSLAIPAIPVAALLVFALGMFFVVYSQGSLDFLRREVISLEKDQGSQYNLAIYAGLNPGESLTLDSAGEKIPLDLTEVFAWQSYKVKRGDSVSKIASAFSVSMDAIIASNGITNARSLREGEVLRIPNMDGIPYTVKNGDSLSAISKSMGVPLEAILDANDLESDVINPGLLLFIPGARMKKEDLKLALGELFIYPLKGAKLSSTFGWRDDPFTGVRRHHAALDLTAPQGTLVKAAMDGKVTAASYDRTYGNFVILSHPGGFQTMYAHLNTSKVKSGDSVSQGAQIGAVGSTGYSTGPHLHFAVFKNGIAVNPLDFLNSSK